MEQYSADDNILFFIKCIVDRLGIFSCNLTMQDYEKFQNLANFSANLFQNLIIYSSIYSKSSYLHYQPPAR